MALDIIWTNKLRSGLTILGVVIGIATVVAISSVVRGLNATINAQMDELGPSVITAFRFNVISLSRPKSEYLHRKELTYDDAIAIRSKPFISAWRWARSMPTRARIRFRRAFIPSNMGTRKPRTPLWKV